MSLPIRTQLKYWGIAAAILFLALWWLGDIILPYVIGAAIAYFLDPVADRLERLGLSRALATAIITITALVILLLILLLVVPKLIEQALDLFALAPQAATNVQDFVSQRFPDLLDQDSTVRKMLASVGDSVQSHGVEVLQAALTSAGSLINIFMIIVIVPVVSFYLLYDWDRMIARIDALLPRDLAPTIRKLAHEIDVTMAGFVRGMGTVCLILGTYYAIALMLAGLNFGLLVGAVAGILTFIPYIGAMIGGILAIGLALFQFWGDWLQVAIIAIIFFIGQLVEGNIVTPKLVGNSVRLHPVWLLFAISFFGALFGFVGMLLAVPVAAALGVIVRFVLERYRDSALYHGGDTAGRAAARAEAMRASTPEQDAP
ncbi:AI-2E family transporter [Pseudooceanicola sp. LIPI14-2-Ac024]|uniref:AI-2E family transporter n=1 Tax=Pseudooceanicola sp. LIPI14-2-Ac024 TaxID=3344875 RepID=UPI0035CFD154